MRFTVVIVEAPTAWAGYGKVRVVHQSRVRPVEHVASTDNSWDIEVGEKEGKWVGTNVGRNSDGRRFIYFAWISESGQQFRRIKLYQDQVTGPNVAILGTMKDGSPACSTARLV